ncbi:5'-AMP-activated protein kinase subunit gamma-2 [Halotydeus destructor]|nr:5'-AMP-activated protein kinase subunit gamma-2 [Halotydeus destructor]
MSSNTSGNMAPTITGTSGQQQAPSLSSFTPFRRRSKSDSKKQGSIISTLRNKFKSGISGSSVDSSRSHLNSPDQMGGGQAPSSSTMAKFHPNLSSGNRVDPYFTYTYAGEYNRSRSRSGSGIPRVFDIFNRNRSQSISAPTELKAQRITGSGETLCEKLEFSDLAENENLVFVKFFKFYHCYDLIPISAKLIVFDTQLLVKKAFHALVSNGVRSAPLWDSSRHSFVGMLTITDFINILRNYHKSSSPGLGKMAELEEQRLETWRNVLYELEEARPLVTIGPNASLFDAVKKLIHNKVHRLPVVDQETGNVLYILTHKRILKFLFLYFYDLPLPRYLDKPLSQLGIGTFKDIAVTTVTSTLIEALDLFAERRVSALPVVDSKGKVVDIYAKFDVINLVAEKTYVNLEITIKKALEYRNDYFEGVIKCTVNDTLRQVMEKIVKAEVHRLVVVDEADRVIGMISLSDILSFLTLKPMACERDEVCSSVTSGVGKVDDHALIEESGEDDKEDADEEEDEGKDSDGDERQRMASTASCDIMTKKIVEETAEEVDEDVFISKVEK